MTTTNHLKARLALATALALGVAAPAVAQSGLMATPPALVGRTLSDETPPVLLAQASDTAQLMLRIQQLEEQIRSLNGQVEGLTFQLTQMQTLVQRQSEENAARFQALEGGAPGKPDAATQQGGATPAPVSPQAPADESNVPLTDIPAQGVQPLPGETEFDPTFDDGSAPMDDLGNSNDPLVGTGRTGGTDLTTGEPLDLTYDPAAGPSDNSDADAQFRAGYEALARGDYAFAEDQFTQFIELYPDNPQVTDAANWLGDALLQRQAYSEAADVLLNAFQKAPDNPRAPELLLKLGMSLSGAGERETACRTFAEVDRRYTTLPDAVKGRLAEEKTKAECPPA
ncbi:tol-pal system protein YbgF [Devosia neptuniae]|uniref:Cell division coordinator CpoB n=1 Tax=Devosia neptuniae TaxID=191302 RepID=A0ABY6CLF1_9HYPH|nr:tol-pal system protein YbgF [Devosia neptuniae]UXN71991.1 tol-pal system protein YbgF [Devosia neptuniae]